MVYKFKVYTKQGPLGKSVNVPAVSYIDAVRTLKRNFNPIRLELVK